MTAVVFREDRSLHILLCLHNQNATQSILHSIIMCPPLKTKQFNELKRYFKIALINAGKQICRQLNRTDREGQSPLRPSFDVIWISFVSFSYAPPRLSFYGARFASFVKSRTIFCCNKIKDVPNRWYGPKEP